ncbi:MucBP domain-containing protein [Facklamia sp. 253]|uniref:MucBP domain-containing protein n=3 Tax=Lactobacillales TaxID=186826 RepID=UPI0013D4EA48|nr:MucBP domain-containing protein [Facklamia sp. 253]
MFFNKKQRFSIRKYKIGVCSVLLGTTIVMGANQVSAEEVGSSEPVTSTSELVDDQPLEEEPTTVSEETVAPAQETETTTEETTEVAAPAIEEVTEAPAPTTEAATEATPVVEVAPATEVEATEEVAADVNIEAVKAEKIELINTYSALTPEVRNEYVSRLQEAVDAAALEQIAREARRAQRRAEAFPNEGQAIPTGTGFRADVPAADEILDTAGWETLGRFSNKPGIFYVQKSGTINGGNSTDRITKIYEVDTTTGNVVEVSKDDFEGGGTLFDKNYELSKQQGFGDRGVANTGENYRAINALGLSNDGRYAYALGFTSDNDVVDRTTINGIYRYDMEAKTWSLVSDSSTWADGMGVLKTNAWTAGAVNPKDGKYYFGTVTLQTDPAFSRIAPRDLADYIKKRDAGEFDIYFRMWSFDPATGTVANAGYIDTTFVKSGKFDKNESYFVSTGKRFDGGESYVIGNDIAFDTEGNFKLILNQYNTSNYFVYEETKAAFDAAASQNDKYSAHNGTLSRNIPILTNTNDIGFGDNADAAKSNEVTTGGLAIDANGDLYFHSRQGKVGRILADLSIGGIMPSVVAPAGTVTWGDAASIRGTVGKGNVYREYYIQGTEDILAGTVGSVVDGKFVPTTETTTGKDDIEKDQALYKKYDATVGRPQAIRAADGTVYEYVQVKENSDPETGEVKKEDQTIRYEYAPKAVTGNVIVKYIDVEGNIIKTEVKDETNADANTPYNTDEDRKLDLIKGSKEFNNEGKIYELVPAGTYGTYNNNPIEVDNNGHLTSSDSTTGDVEAGKTKEVVYVYREVTQPKTGDVVLHYVDTKGNELQPNHHNSDDKPVDENYTVTPTEKPETLEKDGVVYKKVEVSETGVVDGKPIATENVTTEETGTIIDGTKNIVYVYKPVGSVVIHYVNTKGDVIKQEVKDITEGDIDAPYNAADNKENANEKPATIENGNVNYKFKEVATTNTVGGKVVVNENATNVVKGQEGTIVPGTTHVIYVYDEVETPVEPKGSVVVHYVNEAGEVIQSAYKDTTDAAVDAAYNTKQDNLEKPEEITHNGKTYVLTRVSDTNTVGGKEIVKTDATNIVTNKEDGSVVEGTTNVIYVYKLKEEPKAEPKGSVVVHYVNEDGEVIQSSYKDTTDAAVDSAYNTKQDNLEKPEEITHNGNTYVLTRVSDTNTVGGKEIVKTDDKNIVTNKEDGSVVEGTTNVIYVYKLKEEAPKGSVIVNYVDVDGNFLKDEDTIFDTKEGKDGEAYDTVVDLRPDTITKDGKTYKLVEKPGVYPVGTVDADKHLEGTDSIAGSVEAGKTKKVTYVYEEVKPVVPGGEVSAQYFVEGEETRLYKDPTVEEDTVVKEQGTPLETTYKDVPPAILTDKDGNIYDLVKKEGNTPKLKEGSAPQEGNVTETPQVIKYEYKKRETPKAEPKGSVVVHYVNEAGEVIKTEYNDTTNAAVDAPFNTADNELEKPKEITFGGKTYVFKEVSMTPKVGQNDVVKEDATNRVFFLGKETGEVVEGTTHVIYVYSEKQPEENPVKPGGEVTAQYYVEGTEERLYEDPTVEKDTVVKEKNTPLETPYEDTPPVVLTDKDGNIYDLVKNEDGTPKLKEGSAEPTGEVTETPQVIQYEYKKRETPKEEPVKPGGEVTAQYYVEGTEERLYEDPTVEKDTVVKEKNTPLETPYEDTPPVVLTDKDGNIYDLVKKEGNTPKLKEGSAPQEGNVTETPQVIKYEYKKRETPKEEPVKPGGEVTAQYYVEGTEERLYEDPTVEKDTVVKEKNTPLETPYEDTPPVVLTDKDGNIYDLVKKEGNTPKLKEGSAPQEGNVTETPQVIKYEYKKRETPKEEPVKPGGEVTAQYYVEGTEERLYEDPTVEEDEVIKEKDTPLETPYKDTPPAILTDKDGNIYDLVKNEDNTPKLKEGSAPQEGNVTETPQVIQYEYKKRETPKEEPVKPGGEVTAQYYVEGTEERLYEDPTVEEDEVIKEKDTPLETPYKDTPPAILTDKDGNIYDLVKNEDNTPKLKEGSAPQEGNVTETPQVIKYEYKKRETPKEEPKPESPKGSVIVKYEDEEGNEIQDPKEDTPLSPVDTPYNTVDKRDEKIEVPNPNDPENPTVYHLTKNEPKEGEGEDDGKVKEGEKVVTYVYKKAGSVIVHYVDEAGNEIAADKVAKKNEKDGTEYDTTTKTLRPATITVGDKVYERVPAGTYGAGEVDEDGHLTSTDSVDGAVEAGKTKEVTYVYRLVKPVTPESSGEEPLPPLPPTETPNKYIPYIPENPEDPSNPNDPKYPNDPEDNPPLDPNGNPIPPVDYDNTPNDPSDDPRLPDIDGFVPVDPKDPSNPLPKDPNGGYVPPAPENPKEDTPIPYVPAGSVVIHYVDEEGNVLLDKLVDTAKAPVGSDYDTTENTRTRKERPDEIIVTDEEGNESIYELVRVSTSNKVGDQEVVPEDAIVGGETGKVVKGETNVIYVYRQKPGKYIPFIPVDPSNPNDPTDPHDPTDPNNPGEEIPTRPYDETPEDPSDDPRLPDVPGYIPVDPSDPSGKTPLKPVDPEDPTKGYGPPKPVDPKEDTPIPYVPAGTVTVHYVNEKGEVIKDPTVDTPKSPVGTKYDTDEDGKEIPREITGKDGEEYVLVKVKDGDKPTGEVEQGNIDVTYIYKLKEKQTPPPVEEKPNKYIPYIPEDPTDPSNPNDPKYPTDPENNPPLDPNGNPIPPVDYDNTPEDPSDNPPLPDIDGYVPVDPEDPSTPLKPVDPNDPSKGYVPPKPVDPKEDTPVPYVPAGTVTVHYVDEEGNVIKDPTEDTPKSPVGTEYNTDEDGKEIPREITGKDGEEYVLVKVKEGDNPTGVVEKGNIDVTYIYKLKEKQTPPPVEEKPNKYIPYIPEDPTDPSNPNDPKYPTNPENNPPLDPNGNPIPPVDYDNTPEDPSDNPPLPDIDGYVPVDPEDPSTPLKPVDPNDPSKGYVPPKPVDPKKDTPVPYVPAGTVTVHYVDEEGNVIKDPTEDTPKSPVGTEYNTNENGEEVPKEITGKDGKVYELVKVKDGDQEQGKVVKGNTDVTYIYKLKETPETPETPELPEVPETPEKPEAPETPETPETSETPEKPGTPEAPVYQEVGKSAVLPNTGESDSAMAWSAAALSILAGLGLVAPRRKKDEEA